MSIHSKNKGNRYERDLAEYLRELGYDAVTSRAESKNLDDKGVDLFDNSPFYIQAKHVEKMKTSYHDILARMPTEKTPVIFHKRNNKGTIVAMKLEDFTKLLLEKPEEL